MGKLKKILALTLGTIMLLGTVTAAAGNVQYVSCPRCKSTTPFCYCGVCAIADKNNPYHCEICGTQQNHGDWSRCPVWSKLNP